MNRIIRAIRAQLQLNQTRNLLHDTAERLLELDSGFVALLEELALNPDEMPHAADMAALAAAAFLDRVHAVNQFIRTDAASRKNLEDIYLSSWKALRRTRDIEGTLRGHHYPALRAWLFAAYPRGLAKELERAPRIGSVPCAEYSADLQLRMLRLDTARLKEPVLDIGCGGSANLVNHLRGKGLDAHGIDRKIHTPGPWLTEADWLEFGYEPDRWGTILSNLGFTNHFIFALTYDAALAAEYEKAFDRILGSLVPGGSFHYAPGASRLEARADPGRYDFAAWPVSPGSHAVRITRRRPV
jgi:hypothetical protein